VILFVCLFVYDNSKTNDPKVFKLGTGNDLGIAYTDRMILGLKVKRQGHRSQSAKYIEGVRVAGANYALY